jgi:hypothetical protein
MTDVLGMESADDAKARRIKMLEERTRVKDLFQRVFGTEEGQLALIEIVKMSGMFSLRDRDVEHTMRDEGQRHLALGIAWAVYGENAEKKLLEQLTK